MYSDLFTFVGRSRQEEPGLGDMIVSRNSRDLSASLFLEQILVCTYTI